MNVSIMIEVTGRRIAYTSGHQTTARGPDPAREVILSGPLHVVQNTKRIIKKTITFILTSQYSSSGVIESLNDLYLDSKST